jgi:RNA polymerase sigma-70 factor (ECF subfamily)
MGEASEQEGALSADARFATTHWSTVLAAADAQSERASAALASLCRTYWYPVYVYVRRAGRSREDAQDLTQEFFARVLQKRYLDAADPEKGRFRSFLLVVLKGFLANEWDRANRQKRGGGCEILSLDADTTEERYRAEPADDATPERAFERRWATTLLEQVLDRLEKELVNAGKGEFMAALKPFLIGEQERNAYEQVALRLGMTEGAIRVAVHRLRQRYRELLRFEIAQTVSRPEEIDGEIRHLFAAVSS